jgi:hypothetical protein
MSVSALGYNSLARQTAPDGVNPHTWALDQRRELLGRLVDTSMDSAFPADGITKAFQEPAAVEAFLSFVTRDVTELGNVDEGKKFLVQTVSSRYTE